MARAKWIWAATVAVTACVGIGSTCALRVVRRPSSADVRWGEVEAMARELELDASRVRASDDVSTMDTAIWRLEYLEREQGQPLRGEIAELIAEQVTRILDLQQSERGGGRYVEVLDGNHLRLGDSEVVVWLRPPPVSSTGTTRVARSWTFVSTVVVQGERWVVVGCADEPECRVDRSGSTTVEPVSAAAGDEPEYRIVTGATFRGWGRLPW